MGLFKKKTDPISDRAQALNAEIAALEAKIKKLNARAAPAKPAPPIRTAIPAAPATPAPAAPARPAASIPPARKKTGDPIFESVDQRPLKSPPPTAEPRAQFNELGVRKYDLGGFFRRFKGHFQSRSAANPKLVNYLAAGSIQGLRPLRYEKRVARNRFIVLTIVFLAVLWGIIAVFLKHR